MAELHVIENPITSSTDDVKDGVFKEPCQCFDTVTGVWYEAIVLHTTPTDETGESKLVRFSGFPRKSSDCTVKSEHIRSPEPERLLAPRNTAVSRLESSRLLKDDCIHFKKNTQGAHTGVVKINDPFRGMITTTEDTLIGYEDLLPTTTASAPDEAKKPMEKLQHGHNEKKRKPKKNQKTPVTPRAKKKQKAEMLSSATPSGTVDVVDLGLGGSPLKVKLTQTELDKVRDKVKKWKDGNLQSSLLSQLNQVNVSLGALTGEVNNINIRLDSINAAAIKSKSVEDDAHSSSKYDYQLDQSLSDYDYSPLAESALPTYTELLSPSRSIPASTCTSSPSSLASSGISALSGYNSAQSLWEITQSQAVSNVSFSNPPLSNSNVVPCSNLMPLYTDPSTNAHIEHLDKTVLDDLKSRSKDSRTAFAARLVTKLFTIQEVVERNVNGLQNRKRLDGSKIEYIKRTVFGYYPCPGQSQESIWRRDVVTAIDRTNRQRVHAAKHMNLL